jgi:formylglycine-generating enzyme
MVVLPTGYCIDATEVSRVDYADFLRAQPAPSSLAQCAGDDLEPGCEWPGFDEAYEKMKNGDQEYDWYALNRPATCVDWCDAAAYCERLDKHLCGNHHAVGAEFEDFANPNESLWSMACTAAGANDYPYGDEFIAGRCVDSTPVQSSAPTQPEAIARRDGCAGNKSMFACIFDLSGNVAEWENSCDSEQAGARCHVRGGSYLDSGADVSCAAAATSERSTNTDPSVGFRCCKTQCE